MNKRAISLRHSIQIKIGMMLIVLTTLILSGFGIYQYFDLKVRKTAELHELAERTMDRLAENSVRPLWNLDDEQLVKIILSEMREKSVFAVIVRDHRRRIHKGKIRGEDWQIIDTAEKVSGDFLRLSKEIMKNEESLGIVELYLTQQFVQAELQQAIKTILATVVVLDMALFVVLTVSLRTILIRPIYRLLKIANAIADGDFAQEIEIRQTDEIGEFADAFRHMKEKLRENFECIQQEVAERKLAEETLAKERNLLRTLIDNVPDLIYVKDTDSRFLLANIEVMRALKAITLDELIGKTDFELLPSDLAKQFHVNERGIFESGQPLINQEEYSRDLGTGKPKWLLTTKVPFRDIQGKIVGLVGISRDITEIKRTEEELKQHRDRLEELVKERTTELTIANEHLQQEITERKRAEEAAKAANRAKSEFLSNMSHELRTPLNTILGFAQIMARNQQLPDEERENLGLIRRSGEHLLTLINQVLDLSKIEAGRITLNEKNFDLYRLLDDIVDMFRLRAEAKHLQLAFDRAPELPRYISTDEVKLRQVLINLLNNAIKFTKEGGVSVRVARLMIDDWRLAIEKPLHQPTINTQQSTILFEIEDTGPGIAPAELDNLFEAFVQTKTGQAAQEGTGLGLTISQKFVQLMGGNITVDSEVGRGTRFAFHITAGVVDEAEIPTPQPTRRVISLAPNQPQYRLLIVDDKWDNRQLLIKLLSPLGFELREAGNGQEAIEIWEAWEPHLIWMDMRMPVMDGYEATKRIKAATKGQATAIIALTASTFEEEQAVVLSAGCDDFLRKPIKEAEIFDLMHKHLGVQYVYEGLALEEGEKTPGAQPEILTPDALAALPDELAENLKRVIIIGDPEQISRVLNLIREQNALLAEALRKGVENFEYSRILACIQCIETWESKDE